jgi:delta24-sterol reductase
MEYIPIRGQKEYCDKIRELSGAMDKDKKARFNRICEID